MARNKTDKQKLMFGIVAVIIILFWFSIIGKVTMSGKIPQSILSQYDSQNQIKNSLQTELDSLKEENQKLEELIDNGRTEVKKLQSAYFEAAKKSEWAEHQMQEKQHIVDKLQNNLDIHNENANKQKNDAKDNVHLLQSYQQNITNQLEKNAILETSKTYLTARLATIREQLDQKAYSYRQLEQKVLEMKRDIRNMKSEAALMGSTKPEKPETVVTETRIIKNDNDIQSFDNSDYLQWISGIGDTMMLSNEYDTANGGLLSHNNCLYPSVPFKMRLKQQITSENSKCPMKQKNDEQFSFYSQNMVTISCATTPDWMQFGDMNHGNDYLESDNNAFWRNDKLEVLSPNELYLLRIHELTQFTWIRCGTSYDFHITLLPLDSPELGTQLQPQNQIFTRDLAPNVHFLILKGVSRANFIRSFPMTVAYLKQQKTLPTTEFEILQYLRYSTVNGSHNLDALMGSCLSQYYQSLGYYVPFLLNTQGNDEGSDCKVVIPDFNEALPSDCYMQNVKDLVLQWILQSKTANIPLFSAIYLNPFKSIEMDNIDRYLFDLLIEIDKSNSVIHIISDNGHDSFDYSPNILTKYERNNPVSIQIIPKSIAKFVNYDVLKMNEQRLVTHLDMNLFYKQLLYRLKGNNDIPKYTDTNGAVSVIDSVIDIGRKCVNKEWCFCGLYGQIPRKKYSHTMNTQFVEMLIDRINYLTGNGKYDCVEYHSEHFVVTNIVQNNIDRSVDISIEHESDELGDDTISFSSTIYSNHDGTFVIPKSMDAIVRNQDIELKKETCLVMDELKLDVQMRRRFMDIDWSKPMLRFKDETQMMDIIKDKDMYNLNLCQCK